MRTLVHLSIAVTIGLMLLAHPALASMHKVQGRKRAEPPPDEVYYADACAEHYKIPRELVRAIITQGVWLEIHAQYRKRMRKG